MQTTKLSSLVIREQAGATRQERRHRRASPRSSAAAAGRPGWTVASLLQPQLLCPWTAPMDARAAVHRAPRRCRHVVTPPLRKDREEARGAYKRSRCTTVAKEGSHFPLALLPTRKEDEDPSFSSLAFTIATTVPSASTLYCYPHKQQYRLAGRSGFTSTRGP